MLRGARVLMTADAVGGVWTYALDLARGLTGRGASVTLAVLGPRAEDARRREAEASGIAVLDTGAQPEWLADAPAEVEAAAARVADLARAADLVHLNHPVLAGLAALPCPAVGVAHSCVATWWAAVRGTPLPADFAWRAALVGRGCRAVDALIAPSRSFAEATRRAYALPAPPVVVRNGRAAPPASPAFAATPARTVFSAGRLWDEGKGAAILDEAAVLLPCPVELAGATRGPNGAAVALRHARALGTLGEAEVAARLAARPVYAAPALYEPFGLAVTEAAQAGCPLVLSDIPTFRELWDGAALFVPVRDAPALAGAVRGLLDAPARADALGRAAAIRARRYGLDAAVAGTAAVHEAVLGGETVAEARPA